MSVLDALADSEADGDSDKLVLADAESVAESEVDRDGEADSERLKLRDSLSDCDA